MFDSFLTFINRQGVNLSKQKTLLTVSGGVDSIVMANLFHKAGLAAGIAHCNFGLRGEESMLDEMFVRQLGDQYNLPVFVKRFETKNYAKEHAVSTQMAARDLRYAWFEEIREKNAFDWIATAHHASDSLETALLNLARGTGISGLHGIQFQNRLLLRPILFAEKKEILAYARANMLTWRDDVSNDSLDYKRNIVRHKIIPVLKELNPSLESTFKVTSERIRAADILLTEYLDAWKRAAVRSEEDEIFISIPALLSESEPAYRLWSVLSGYGFSYIQTGQIIKSIYAVSGKIFYSESHSLLKDRGNLILKPIFVKNLLPQPVFVTEKNGSFTFGDGILHLESEQKSTTSFDGKQDYIIHVDEDQLLFPLTVRKWLPGDICYPLGMKGKRKKISDILVDKKMNLYQKEKVHVLVNGNGEIIWVVGIRMDERYKISDETKNATKITWEQISYVT